MAKSDVEEDEQTGLFDLWPPIDSDIQTTVDIVAVHGLGGGPYKTWTEGERLWLRDFLPISIPEARIMTFGYDSGVAFHRSASGITDFAKDLLGRVRARRRKYPEGRPLIFICHSLGGIVFKKALVLAHERDSYFGSLLRAITGVIFMGTPHQGADIAYWSNILGKLANIPLLGSIRTNLLKDLEPKSNTLGEICSQFVERGAKLQIFTFYERLKTTGLGDLVVNDKSAILHLPNEMALPLESDHRGLCKFVSASSQKYTIVLNSLQELIDGPSEEKQRRISKSESAFLDDLYEFRPVSILNQLPEQHAASCKWILESPEFESWMRPSSHRLLWIHGSAGSGKSVLTKFVVKHLQQMSRSAANSLPNNADARHLICYTFCNEKDSRRNNGPTILRSILHQIISQATKLIHLVDDEPLEDLDPLTENLETLWTYIYNVLKKATGIRFWIILDALDELPESTRKPILQGFDRVIKNDLVGRLKVLLTDRRGLSTEYDSIRIPDYFSFDLNTPSVYRDVENFIIAEVDKLCRDQEIPQELQRLIERELIERSHGLFLSASLNLANFSDGVIYWNRSIVLERLQELRKYPSTLESLYCNLLRKVPQTFHEQLRKIFLWILTARQPLNVQNLHFAISVMPEHRSYEDVTNNLGFTFEVTLRRFCGHFLRVNETGEVGFSHQSVKDLLTTKASSMENAETIEKFQTSNVERETSATSTCLLILMWPEFASLSVQRILLSVDNLVKSPGKATIESALKGRPMLLYAAKHWASHFSKVQESSSLVKRVAEYVASIQGNYFRLVTGEWTSEIRKINSFSTSVLPFRKPPLHSLIQLGDFPQVAQLLVNTDAELNEIDSEGMTPLHWALVRHRHRTLDFLLATPGIDPNRAKQNGNKPIHVCIDPQLKNVDGFKKLLESKQIDVNARGQAGEQTTGRMGWIKGKTALQLVVRHLEFYEDFLDSLLQHSNTNMNACDEDGVVPFIRVLSSEFGETAANMFLAQAKSRLDITVVDKNGTNAFSLASMRRWTKVRRQLYERDRSQVFSLNNDGMNAFTRAAFWGEKSLLQSLLSDVSPADMNRFANQGRFDLTSLCAQQDWEDIVDQLQDKFGLVSLDQNQNGQTLLHLAVISGWNYSYRDHSPLQKLRINVQDGDGKTPLHLAAEYRNFKAAKSLLDQGADIFLREKYGKTPVHVAAEFGSREILNLFLNMPIREYGRDFQGRGLLHFLATWEWESVLSRYVEDKRPMINILDRNRLTPLHYAAIYGNFAIANYLILKGASLSRRDAYGLTPLQRSIQQGHVDITKLLCEYGGDCYQRDAFLRTSLQISLYMAQPPMVNLMLSKWIDLKNFDRKGKTALHRISNVEKHEICKVVERFLARGAEINSRDAKGFTPLHSAVFLENIHAITTLIGQKDIDLSIKDECGRTALDLAYIIRNSKIIEILKEKGAESSLSYKRDYQADIEYSASQENNNLDWKICHFGEYSTDDEDLADEEDPINESIPIEPENPQQYEISNIHQACRYGRIDDVKIFLEAPGAWESQDAYGWTPLHIAASGVHKDIASMLIHSGKDLSIQSSCGWTAIQVAMHAKDIEIISMLLRAGVDLKFPSARNKSAILRLALRARQEDTLALLLKYGADPNARISTTETALVYAIQGKNTTAVKQLLLSGADPNARIGTTETALMYAVQGENPTMVEQLLLGGADPNARTSTTETALMYAVRRKNPTVVEKLLLGGADPNGEDPHRTANDPDTTYRPLLATISAQRNPASRAEPSINCDLKIMELLLLWGAEVNLQKEPKDEVNTPLLKAVQRCRHDTRQVELLLRKGANPNVISRSGGAPLHHICKEYMCNNDTILELVKILLAHGADPNVVSRKGIRPLHYVSQACCQDIRTITELVKILLTNGADPTMASLQKGIKCGWRPSDFALVWNTELAEILWKAEEDVEKRGAIGPAQHHRMLTVEPKTQVSAKRKKTSLAGEETSTKTRDQSGDKKGRAWSSATKSRRLETKRLADSNTDIYRTKHGS